MTRPKRPTIRVGGQNMTEGPVTDALRSCSLVLLQETDPARVWGGFPSSWRFLFDRDGHMCIGWDTNAWASRGKGHRHMFHGSGAGDPDIPDAIHTPARGLLEKPLRHRATKTDLDAYTTWLLNSWRPAGHGDRWTADRERIVLERELPVVREQLRQTTEAKRAGIIEADWNTLRGRLRFDGWDFAQHHGLDRFAATGLHLVKCEEAPKTGRGNDMQHHGLIATYEIGA